MRRELYLLLFLFFLLNQGCIHWHKAEFQFNEEEKITGTSISVSDSVSFCYPFRIRQEGSYMYVMDMHAKDYYCYKLSRSGIGPIKSFAHVGNGPDDCLSIENIRVRSDGHVYLLDANKGRISIHETRKGDFIKQINLSKDLIRCLDFDLIDDSLFVIPNYSGKYRINIVDHNGEVKKQLFKIPLKTRRDDHVSDIALAQAWRSFIDYNPNNGILAMATQLGQVIEIYNLKTNETVNILYGKFGEPKFINQNGYAIPNGIMGYSDVYVGSDAIYAVFWGTSFKDIQKHSFNTVEGGNIIQVFSLTGKPMKQYTLDRHITGFSIDEENKKLMGLDVNNNQQIIEYQL